MDIRQIIDLSPANYNPRRINEAELDKLVKSIKEFGFVEPVVINKDNTVIGGHQRLKAAQILGMTEVPVIYVDIDKGKERALNLALNRISGEFDEEMLSVLLQEMDEADRNLSGFDEKEIEKALNAALTVEEDDYNLEPPKESKTKLGDIYQLGGYVNCPECNEKLELGKQCLR